MSFNRTNINRTFIGTIIESGDNEFTDHRGEQIKTYKIGILTSGDRGIIFHVGLDHPEYDNVRQFSDGDVVKIVAEPKIQNNGNIKHRLISIELNTTE